MVWEIPLIGSVEVWASIMPSFERLNARDEHPERTGVSEDIGLMTHDVSQAYRRIRQRVTSCVVVSLTEVRAKTAPKEILSPLCDYGPGLAEASRGTGRLAARGAR